MEVVPPYDDFIKTKNVIFISCNFSGLWQCFKHAYRINVFYSD